MNKLVFFCPLWGSESLPFETFLRKAKDAGYDGIEMSLPLDKNKREDILLAIKSNGLKFIAQHWETVDKDFDTHLANYQKRLYNLAGGAPLFINSQTGKDYYSFEQNAAIINAAKQVSLATTVPVIHETHRGKFSFAPHITMDYLKRIPSLELCLDISHWCCVAESFLEDQQEAVSLAIEHTRHIHSRIGFTEGPQVMDPRADEWKDAVERHLAWWSRIVSKNELAGLQTTVTTEFGPFPYLQHLPYTNKPIYDQWEVNVYMMQLLRSSL